MLQLDYEQSPEDEPVTPAKPAEQRRRPRGTGERPIRGVRVPDNEWQQTLNRAHSEGHTRAAAIAQLAAAYSAKALTLPPADGQPLNGKSRSLRLTDTEWNAVSARADLDNATPGAALSRLIIGYARNIIDLPRLAYVLTYPQK